MKRYLMFYGMLYYPCGGMSDFHSDYDSLQEAKDAAYKYNVENMDHGWSYAWAHVYDLEEKTIIWQHWHDEKEINSK